MLKPLHALVLAVLALCSTAVADDPPPFVPDEVVVRLAPGADAAQFAAQFGSVVLDSIASRNIHRLAVPATQPSELDFIDLIDDDNRVVGVELNFLADDRDPNGGTQSIFILAGRSAFINQGGVGAIGVDAAGARALGAGVVVAVIDTGVDPTHPVLRGSMPLGGVDLIDGGEPLDVGDGIDNDGNGIVDDFLGHGTFIAGLVLRVAPEAIILPIRVMDDEGGVTTFRMIDGIYVAIDRGADIINISMGTVAPSELLQDAVVDANAAGRLIVAAAGNEGTDQVERFPAAFDLPGLISVAATGEADKAAAFTNFGDTITISAPGANAFGPMPGGGYASASGTSYAAPLVAGAAALLRSVTPGLAMQDTRQRLLDTAVNIDGINPNLAGKLGAGRLDAAAALGIGGPALPANADLNGDRRVEIEDMYEFARAPVDLTGDGIINDDDHLALEAFVRRFERLPRRAW